MVVDVEFYKPPKDFKIAVLLKEELILKIFLPVLFSSFLKKETHYKWVVVVGYSLV